MRAERNNGHDSRENRKYTRTGQSKAQYWRESTKIYHTPVGLVGITVLNTWQS